MIYNPKVISYQKLVDHYIENTSNNVRPTTGQYRYIVFHANQEQEEYITDYVQELRDNDNLYFSPEPIDQFYMAENYHQKYQLRTSKALYESTLALYTSEEALIDSHLAAKLNAFRSGFISQEEMFNILDSSFLSPIYPGKIQQIKNVISD